MQQGPSGVICGDMEGREALTPQLHSSGSPDTPRLRAFSGPDASEWSCHVEGGNWLRVFLKLALSLLEGGQPSGVEVIVVVKGTARVFM